MRVNKRSTFLRVCLLFFVHERVRVDAGGSIRVRADSDNSSSTLTLDIVEDSGDARNLIIGGAVATPNEYPYFVHLPGTECGGTLIAPDIVLTAGHVSSLDREKII